MECEPSSEVPQDVYEEAIEESSDVVKQQPFCISAPQTVVDTLEEETETGTHFNLVCAFCGTAFSKRSNLNRHLRKFHPDAIVPERKNYACKEADCSEAFCDSDGLQNHLQYNHGMQFETVNIHFTQAKEFYKWFTQIQKEKCIKFIQQGGISEFADGSKKILYYCHRSGTARVKLEDRKRPLRTKYTKSDMRCTARLTTRLYSENRIEVYGCLTHYYHSLEQNGPPLAKMQKNSSPQATFKLTPTRKVFGLQLSEILTKMRTLEVSATADINEVFDTYVAELQQSLGQFQADVEIESMEMESEDEEVEEPSTSAEASSDAQVHLTETGGTSSEETAKQPVYIVYLQKDEQSGNVDGETVLYLDHVTAEGDLQFE